MVWSWPTSRKNVRSYPHIVFNEAALPVTVDNITKFELQGSWQITASPIDLASNTLGMLANVAWDIFADADPKKAGNDATALYEIMFWMGTYGQPQPLGFSDGPCLKQTLNGVEL